MNGILKLNRPGPFFCAGTESLDDSIMEHAKRWLYHYKIFEFLKGGDRGTSKERKETVRYTNIFIDDFVEEYSNYTAYSQMINNKSLADIFPVASQRLQMLETLTHNWNGDHASPPSAKTINHAYQVLFVFWQAACERKTKPPEPRVTCGARGDITFAWTIGDKELELGFLVDDGAPRYEYLICLASDPEYCEEGVFEGMLTNSPTYSALFSESE